MYKVRGKFTNFTVIDNLKKEPDITQKLTNSVIHKEFDKINGKARHSKNIDPKAVAQAQLISNQPLAKNTTMVEQPDCHFGAGVPIGTTLRLNGKPNTWKVSPTIVSGDIGCGVLATRVNVPSNKIDFKRFDKVVEQTIPSAFHDRIHPINLAFSKKLATKFDMSINKKVMYDLIHSLGTLGSGNHFLELDKGKHGNYWLIIHSGSRHVGTDIFKHYLRVTHDEKHAELDAIQNKMIQHLKHIGHEKEIETWIKKFKKAHPILKNAYRTLSDQDLKNYLHDTVLGQKFATQNRHEITNKILKEMGWTINKQFETIHNYFNLKDNTIRKGAISGHKGELVSIPLNMRDGTLFAIAKGNPKFNYSLPHGAGRKLPRHIARKVLSMKQFREDMKGIHSSSIDKFTLDEAPEAYKPFTQITNNITPNAKIIDRVKPVYNYKDHESDAKFQAFLDKIHKKQ